MQSFTREENAVIGKWREVSDEQSYSYDKIPSTCLLSRIAGFGSVSDYMPPWRQISPPSTLVHQVLSRFHDELVKAEKVSVS